MRTREQLIALCDNILAYAHRRDYSGYNKFDGLESPLTRLLSFNNKWARLFWSQLVMRSPVNIRPLLGIPEKRNPKGIALFAWALLDLHKATDDKKYLSQAKALLKWLNENQAQGFEYPCWGYAYPWQDTGFYAPARFPNRIVTYFVCRAFLKAWEVTGENQYFETVKKSIKFIIEAPRVLFESEDMKCLSYVPSKEINWVVMDVSALSSVIAAGVAKETQDPVLMSESRRLINYVVDKQTDYGAWYYSHPPKDSHIGHDNYHTGYIVDAIKDYMELSGDYSFKEVHNRGLKYYSEKLFTRDGAPKWMSHKNYPFDIHGSAQGIITFSRYPEYSYLAERILSWTLKNMYSGKGYFYYQKRLLYTKRYTLMRWCNAWMARALSAVILSR
ncbi:MAG: hypothetical protein ABIA63_01030 [bacterium]